MERAKTALFPNIPGPESLLWRNNRDSEIPVELIVAYELYFLFASSLEIAQGKSQSHGGAIRFVGCCTTFLFDRSRDSNRDTSKKPTINQNKNNNRHLYTTNMERNIQKGLEKNKNNI
jgi:hypothetical protein